MIKLNIKKTSNLIIVLTMLSTTSGCTFLSRMADDTSSFFYDRLLFKKPVNYYENKRIFQGNIDQQELLLKKRERQALWDEYIKGNLDQEKPKAPWSEPNDGSY